MCSCRTRLQITILFDHQYMLKETSRVLDFSHRDSMQGRQHVRLLLVGCAHVCPVICRHTKTYQG